MIHVAVSGCAGRMGATVVAAVLAADDMDLVCGIDPHQTPAAFPVYKSVPEALAAQDTIDVLIDFTEPSSVADNIRSCLAAHINCVVGTTGLTPADLEKLAEQVCDNTCLFYAPNFTIGAVLMMQFAEMAAKYFPEAEVIEFHHCHKKDAPSGTAMNTARRIAAAHDHTSLAPGRETEVADGQGARGALVEGVPVHSVRSNGYSASQEVIFGSMGQTLTIRHDSWDRASYMPGVLLAVRAVIDREGLIIGLENLMA